MFKTMTQIGKEYDIDAKEVGKALYRLKIRDADHPVQKGFPFEQAITHGIAKLYEGRSGEAYYRYNIDPVKEEFERLIADVRNQKETTDKVASSTLPQMSVPVPSIETKLKEMLTTLDQAIVSGETQWLYRLKADIADIYALLPHTGR